MQEEVRERIFGVVIFDLEGTANATKSSSYKEDIVGFHDLGIQQISRYNDIQKRHDF